MRWSARAYCSRRSPIRQLTRAAESESQSVLREEHERWCVHAMGKLRVRLSLDEPAAFRVAERCAQNLMHVEHRLGCEGCSVVTSMGAQRGVKTVEVRDSQAAKRNATDAWQYILLGHLAVPVVGSRAEPTFTRGEPAPAHESSQRHPARSVGACPCSGERCCKCLRRRFPASVSVRTHCPRCRVVIVLLAFGLVQ